MRTTIFAVLTLALGACGQPPSQEAAPNTPEPSAMQTPPEPVAVAPVEGWEISPSAFAGVGKTLSEFSGAEFTRDSLRHRWTILGFIPPAGASGDEPKFIAALASAVNQDPDLDFIQIGGAESGSLATALGVTGTPEYLLVGPDLTVEAWRGALSAAPDDGIKSVIRGIAEIRKQVSAPH